MLNVLYLLEALRHKNVMPGLLPELTRKDIEQLPIFFFYGYGSKCKTKDLLYILEALRHNTIMPGLLRG